MVGSPLETGQKPAQASPPINGSYDPKTYETEIKKALGHSSIASLRQTPEGKKEYKDLEQTIHIEMWGAIKRYGDKMTPALAYQIAWNHVTKFIDKRVKQPTIVSVFNKPETEAEELAMLRAEKLLAKHDTEGIKTWEFSDTSFSKMGNPGSWDRALQERGGMALLEKLVSYWHGTKRLVADAMLRDPDMTVRDIPGIPKTTVARVRQIVLKEFKNLIRTPLPSTNRVLARKFLKFIGDRRLTMEMLLALPTEEQQNIKSTFLTENKRVTE